MTSTADLLPRPHLTKVITPKVFKSIIGNSLLSHRINQTYDEVIDDIYYRVNSGHYYPLKPLGVYSLPKHNLVPRLVPVLRPADNLLYHYLVKNIEDRLLWARPEEVKTFGAFNILTQSKKSDEDRRKYDFIEIEDVSLGKYTVSYNWYPGWGDYTATVKNYLDQYPDKKVFVKTDIANFYDNIDLRLLENKVRSCLGHSELFIVNVLFRLLQGINSFSYKYNYQGKGLPQDETSDCSRLLANFFLYDFDVEADSACRQLDCLFIRYCDDMIIMCNDRASAEKVVHTLASELNKIGLSLNSSKTRIFNNRSSFEKYWMFNEHKIISDNVKSLKKQTVYDKIQQLVLQASKLDRGFPLVKRWVRLYDDSMANDPRVKRLTDKALPHTRIDVAVKYIGSQSSPSRQRLLNGLYNKYRKSNYSADLLWFRRVCELLGEKSYVSRIDKYIFNHPNIL